MTEPNDSAVTKTALPDEADRVNESATPPSTERTESCAHGGAGERAAGPASQLFDGMRNLILTSERHGYGRGYAAGVLATIRENAERLAAGEPITHDWLVLLTYRPILCRYCSQPLSRELRGANVDVCAKCANGVDLFRRTHEDHDAR